ncbi:MAG: hypothetical protein HOW97_10070 [Catenulispora sp.]|nr:hypothetical protein [Catenulispora sp.]
MSDVEFSYRELSETPHLEQVPLAHLSIQVGRVRPEDFADPGRPVARRLEQAAPWLEAAGKQVRDRFGHRARISTCLLVDDHSPSASALKAPEPAAAMELLARAADAAGFGVDYLARYAGCAVACDRPRPGFRDRHPLADIVASLIVPEAAVGANGSRPPTEHTGWLANGQRSPDFRSAMDDPPAWSPPVVFGRERHSVFVDVELWSLDQDSEGGTAGGAATDTHTHPLAGTPSGSGRQYSISLLTAVWHLLRLGLLRDAGEAVAVPYRFAPDEPVPDLWSQLPSITQLTPDPAPFCAYQALSLLASRHRDAELAAGIVLDHVRLDDRVLSLIAERALAEPVPFPLPSAPIGRISHLFLDDFLDDSYVRPDT